MVEVSVFSVFSAVMAWIWVIFVEIVVPSPGILTGLRRGGGDIRYRLITVFFCGASEENDASLDDTGSAGEGFFLSRKETIWLVRSY